MTPEQQKTMPYNLYVRNNTGWHVARYYPTENAFYLIGNEFPFRASDFSVIGNKVEMPK